MYFIFNNFYVAIIGDIVQSKQMSNRNAIQLKLKQSLNSINKRFTKDIASNFMITLGDEFQGLLKCGENVVAIISEIESTMYPIHIRFGIGVGGITTNIDRQIPLGADGPAYYNARNMIECLRKMEKKVRSSYSNIMICSQPESLSIDTLLNAIFSLCSTIKRNWTDRQREIVNAFIESDDNQYKAAEKLGIEQSSVNRGLSNAEYYTYKNAIDTASSALSEIRIDNDV